MAKNRYNVYYTDTTLAMINALEKEGHQQRDIINAGVVLFYRATDEERGKAHMAANVKQKERLKSAVDMICNINIEFLGEEDAKRVQDIRRMLAPADDEHPNHNGNKKIS